MSGCIHNYEPKIDSINADPNPAPIGSVVNLTCNASDNDEIDVESLWSIQPEIKN